MVFQTIKIIPPRKQIYQRLGYHREITQLTFSQEKLTDSFIDEATSFITLKGVALRIPIVKRNSDVVLLERGILLRSLSLASFLRGCTEVVLMGATVGYDVIEATKDSMRKNATVKAAVFDATASEMADGALGWLMDYYRSSLLRERKNLFKKRYSAGYGDFDLENQRYFYDLLDLGAIDVQITTDNILVPEKSVTAVTGIQNLEEY